MTTLNAQFKGYPTHFPSIQMAHISAQRWNVLRGDFSLPLAIIKRGALQHNLQWMQAFCAERNLSFAPHGKTTMSPALFKMQQDSGAWGMSFATVYQASVAVAHGVRTVIIANQVFQAADLAGLAHMLAQHLDLRVYFLVDSIAQIEAIEAWRAQSKSTAVFSVLLELGLAGKRTGTRTHGEALALAACTRASAAVSLRGIECYEGALASCDSVQDREAVRALMQRVEALASAIAANDGFDGEEVLLSAGGSSIFDLVADHMQAKISKPVRRVLRSGCYVTHDHMHYARHLQFVGERLRTPRTLKPALEVLCAVQSHPEPGLALLTMGRRDVGYDIDLPCPLWRGNPPAATPTHWKITALNDQHAYLHYDASATQSEHPHFGQLIGCGISHPCTTFDKWHWMPIVDDNFDVVDAISIHF